MYTFEKFIGHKMRRCIYSLCIKGEYYHLMSIIESMEDDMSDLCNFQPNVDNMFLDRCEHIDSKKPRVFVRVEEVQLTEAMYKEPWKDFELNAETKALTNDFYFQVVKHLGCDIIHLSDNNSHSILNILPKRSCPEYISYYSPQEENVTLENWLRNENIRKQLSELSQRNFGCDICVWDKYIGKYIFVFHNPVYRSIQWKENVVKEQIGKGINKKDILRNDGVCCQINYRKGQRQLLIIKIEAYDDFDVIINEKIEETNSFALTLSMDIPDDKHPKYYKAYVYDKGGVLIDYYKLDFIHTLNMGINIHEATIQEQDENGSVIREIEKYRSASSSTIGELLPASILEEDIYSYKKLEDALDFVFINGDKNNLKNNREKGIEVVKRILNTARKRCYICDVYFNHNDFKEFVWEISLLDVEVKILTSPLASDDYEEKEKMRALIDDYNNKIHGKVECRLLSNKPLLHDRLIVADDNVWMLGSSLNHFGKKATTLIRVPRDYRKKIIEQIDQWWINEAKELPTMKKIRYSLWYKIRKLVKNFLT